MPEFAKPGNCGRQTGVFNCVHRLAQKMDAGADDLVIPDRRMDAFAAGAVQNDDVTYPVIRRTLNEVKLGVA